MTIDERAAACVEEVEGAAYFDWREIIARHLREAVAERDALLKECRHLLWHHHVGEGCVERIDAMIGEQA